MLLLSSLQKKIDVLIKNKLLRFVTKKMKFLDESRKIYLNSH